MLIWLIIKQALLPKWSMERQKKLVKLQKRLEEVEGQEASSALHANASYSMKDNISVWYAPTLLVASFVSGSSTMSSMISCYDRSLIETGNQRSGRTKFYSRTSSTRNWWKNCRQENLAQMTMTCCLVWRTNKAQYHCLDSLQWVLKKLISHHKVTLISQKHTVPFVKLR